MDFNLRPLRPAKPRAFGGADSGVILAGSAILAVLLLLRLPGIAGATPIGLHWGSYSPTGTAAYGVRDADGITVLQTGNLAQLIFAGDDGQIDPALCDGRPGGDDELLQTSAVQNAGAFPPPLRNKGYIPQKTFTFDSADRRVHGRIYIRAWNAASATAATAWGDSALAELLPGAVVNAARWSTSRHCTPRGEGDAAGPAVTPGAGKAEGAAPIHQGSSVAGASTAEVIPSAWYLVAWPLLVADPTPDGTLGQQLHGTENPETADRVLVWNAASQTFQMAWFCGGTTCEGWGAPWANHWLAQDYSPTSLTLPPDAGFWLENRSGAAESLSISGVVAETDRTVQVGAGWQLLASAIPLARSLDVAGFPATNSDSPETADQIYYWDAGNRSYRSAWFCGGQSCLLNVGQDYVNHWLAGDYSLSNIVLEPGHGFWYLNRHTSFTWTNHR